MAEYHSISLRASSLRASPLAIGKTLPRVTYKRWPALEERVLVMARPLQALLLVALLVPLALAQPTVRIRAENGEPLVGALIRVTTLDGRTAEFELSPGAPFTVKDVVLGRLTVEVVSWKGVPIGYKRTVEVREDMTILVPGVNTATIKVVGSRGQGLPGTRVEIYYGGTLVESGAADESGVYRTTLPTATYRVVAEYGGRRAEAQAQLPGEVTLSLDVFATVAGVPLSPSEVLGAVALAALLALAVFIAAYEYSTWRRRRVAKVVAPPA